MALGAGLTHLDGYPFEVRHSKGAVDRARACADITALAYGYFGQLFSGFKPDIAVVVVAEGDWKSRQPYGLPFFNNDDGQIRPGIIVMPAGSGDFWTAIGTDLREASPLEVDRLLATYPDGHGGLDLQPFFDLVTIHELGHAFETLGDLRLPTFWLSEIFANLALHAFVASKQPESLETLEVLSTVGAHSEQLAARMASEGYTTLEELEAHYTGGEDPMSPLNYVWYQYRWQRIAAAAIRTDGEDVLVRLWDSFRARDRFGPNDVTTASLATLLEAEVSETLGRAIHSWQERRTLEPLSEFFEP